MSYQMPRSIDGSPHNQAFPGTYNNPADMPATNPKEQTIMWQRNNYMSGGRDSGIQSGVSTQATSISGKEDEMLSEPIANDMFDWDQSNFTPNFTQNEVNEMNQHLNQSRSQRGRAAIYPETLEEETETQSMAVQKLTEPSQVLKSVVNLINYQDDAGLGARAVSDLIKLLNDEDHVVVNQAALIVHHLSKAEASRHAFYKSPEMVPALLRAVSNSSNLETAKCAAGIIHNLSLDQQGLLSIFKSSGIPVLVGLLRFTLEGPRGKHKNFLSGGYVQMIKVHKALNKLAGKSCYNEDSNIIGNEIADRAVKKATTLLSSNTKIDYKTAEQKSSSFIQTKIPDKTSGHRTMPFTKTTFKMTANHADPTAHQSLLDSQTHLLNSSSIESVLFYAVTTLHNLLLHEEGRDFAAKIAVKNAGGIQKMIALLHRDNVLVLDNNGLNELVRIMKSYNYEKLLLTTARLLKVLSVCQKCKVEIVKSGGMQALALHLKHGNNRLIQNCMWTLRNLSDAGTKEMNVELLLQRLVQSLASKDINVVTCATGILSNLTCNNQANKITVYQNQGVQGLIYAIMQAGDCLEVIEPSICALRHLTRRYPYEKHAQKDIRDNYGIQFFVSLLQPPTRWHVVKAVIGLIRNMSLSQDNHEFLRECGVIHHLIQILFHANQLMQQHVNVSNYDGVKIEELIEAAIGVLQILTREEQNRAVMREPNIIKLFIQFLFSNIINIQKVSTAFLDELAVDKYLAEMIEKEGGTVPLNALMQSPNECLANSARSLILKISNWIPQDDKKRLSVELAHSLLHDVDSQNWVNGDLDLSPILPNDPYNDLLYSASGGPSSFQSNIGPPSVHSNTDGRAYDQPSAVDMGSNYGTMIDDETMDIDRNSGFEFDHNGALTDPAMGTPPHLQQIGPSPAPQIHAWFDTDL
ncbi:Armadillo segment polarity protein [Nymphon striatum]|nr:Armadillo segment polarity protein [Nymphon striatum]